MTRPWGAVPSGMALLVGTGLLWGTIGPVSREITLTSSLDAVSITWLRSAIASAVCLAAAWTAMGSNLFRAGRRDTILMTLFGLILIAYQWLYLAAIDEIGVSAATLISLCAAPVIVAGVSTVLLHESFAGPVGVALVGAIAGTVLLIGTPETGAGRATLIGATLALACASLIAAHVMGMRSIARRVHPLQPHAIGFTVGTLAITPVALYHGVSLDQPASAWAWLLYLGLFPSSMAYLFYQRGLRDVPASVASIVTMLEPLVAAILAWFMFDERLGFWGWVGGALLMASIWLLTVHARQPRPSAHVVSPAEEF